MANVAPSTASMTEDTSLPVLDHRMAPSTIATSNPAMGVHKPTTSNTPAAAPTTCGTAPTHLAVSDKQMNP
jgi:hypothetical protein